MIYTAIFSLKSQYKVSKTDCRFQKTDCVFQKTDYELSGFGRSFQKNKPGFSFFSREGKIISVCLTAHGYIRHQNHFPFGKCW